MKVISRNRIGTIIRVKSENWQQRFLAIQAEGWLEGTVLILELFECNDLEWAIAQHIARYSNYDLVICQCKVKYVCIASKPLSKYKPGDAIDISDIDRYYQGHE